MQQKGFGSNFFFYVPILRNMTQLRKKWQHIRRIIQICVFYLYKQTNFPKALYISSILWYDIDEGNPNSPPLDSGNAGAGTEVSEYEAQIRDVRRMFSQKEEQP